MKGIVFNTFVDFVEGRFGLRRADAMIQASGSPSGGAYTSVGTYPVEELQAMLEHVGREEGREPPELLEAFGEALFVRLMLTAGDLVGRPTGVFDLARELDRHIHVEVRKLFPDADPPRFDLLVDEPHRLHLLYRSRLPLADLARGLFRGCCAHFGEDIEVIQEVHGAHTLFRLERRA